MGQGLSLCPDFVVQGTHENINENFPNYGRLAHCESCVQGIALKAMKIQLLDYPLPKSSQISKTEKPLDLRNQQIWCRLFWLAWELGDQSWRTADLIICEPACKCSVHNSQNYSCF